MNTESLNLEDLFSDGHKIFDDTSKALVEIGGIIPEIKKGSDSRTNISVSIGLGLGDCRHHAQIKQLLFDMWQWKRTNSYLQEGYDSLMKGDNESYQEAMDQIDELHSYELRTFDFVVEGEIEMIDKYKPRLNDQGEYIYTEGVFSPIEDHTMNLLIKKDSKGNVKSVRFADSFYQNHYDWGSGEISIEDIFSENGIGGKTIKAGSKRARIRLVPTDYCGKRNIDPRDDHGQLLCMGIPIGDIDVISDEGRERSENFKAKILSNFRAA